MSHFVRVRLHCCPMPAALAFAAVALLAANPSWAADCAASAVDIALGRAPLASCPQADSDGSGAVNVADLVAAAGASATTANPRGAAGPVTITVGNTIGAPGATVSFDVSLDSAGQSVAGAQNDIAYDPLTPIAETLSGDPDCTVNPATGKDLFLSFLPAGCTYGIDCTSIRAIVISLVDVDPIPDGALYSCKVKIDAAAPGGLHPLDNSNADSSDPGANELTTDAVDGVVSVSSLDNFTCYKAKDLKAPKFQSTTLPVTDQFGSFSAEVKKPFLLCNPTSVNGGAVNDVTGHLVCYKVKGPKLSPRPSGKIGNALGELQLQASKPYVLCVPSSKTPL
jgi:hypothetical protein